MNPSHLRAKFVSTAVLAAFSALPSAAQASGFALIEQSASGMGNAYAGSAAAAEDASTIYFNPAGLSLLPAGKQISISGHQIMPKATLNNSGSVGATLFGGASPNSGGGDAGKSAFVPNAYFSMEIAPRWRAGVGINVPFGLATEYQSDWIGRFQGIRSAIETININPTVSYKATDAISLGFGLNYQTIDAELTSKSNYAAAVASAAGAGAAAGVATAGQAEGLTTLKGKDSSWGWNAGAMFTLSPQTRLGVAYRSRIKYNVTGTVQFDNRPGLLAAAAPNGNIALGLTMPDNFSMALSHTVNDRWQVLGDLSWTGWHVLERFLVTRTNNVPASGATLNNIPYNWKNTWRAGVGANYKLNDSWILKGGLAYDQTPTNDTDRGPRLPDQNRTWLSLGAKYAVSKAGTLDVGYSHIFIKDAPVNINAGGNLTNSTAAYGLIRGNYAGSVDILSVSYTHSF